MALRFAAAALASASWLLPSLAAQQPGPVSPPPTGASMLATERFLFVVRNDVLYQFDVDTLELLHSFAFPGERTPVPPRADVATPVEPERPAPGPAPADTNVRRSIDAALKWLAAHQDSDGKWDADGFMKHDPAAGRADGPGNAVHDVGITGLAVLAMLGDGSTLRAGPYKDNLKLAVKWLLEQQRDNGLIGMPTASDFIYDHAIAAFALCEAYGLSKYASLKKSAQNGINYLEAHRNPYAVWRYQPRDNDNDTSVTTWALLACDAGRTFDLEVNPNVFKMVEAWYDRVTTPDGRAGYTKKGEPSSRHPGDHGTRFPVGLSESLTAAALFGRLVLGQEPDETPVMMAAAKVLAAKPPQWRADRIDASYWFYGTMALSRIGGAPWRQWQQGLREVIAHQRRDGSAAGSWDPVGVWDQDGGRVFTTALCALSLQALHRAAGSADGKPAQKRKSY